MLLPSSLPSGPRPQLQRFSAYSHERVQQLTPPPPAQGINGACYALQSVLGTQSRKRNLNSALHANARVLKRLPSRPKGQKRERAGEDSDPDIQKDSPSTPKRQRRPTSVPFGLAPGDFVDDGFAMEEKPWMPTPDEGYGSLANESLRDADAMSLTTSNVDKTDTGEGKVEGDERAFEGS